MSIRTYFLFLFLLNTSNAYPSGAGHCNEGDLTNKSFFTHGNAGSGSLSNGGLQVKVDANVLNAESKTIVEGGKSYKLVLEGGDFKGFLIRLASPDGRDVYEYLSESSSNIQRKRGGLCSSTVAAMTHTSRLSKSSIEIDLIVPTLAGNDAFDLRLDVTVVIANGFGSRNAWHYDLFGLAVQEKATSNPTSTPTETPTTVASNLPTSAPSNGPSNILSSAPSNEPSNDPTDVPSIASLTSPSITPSKFPTLTPSLTPSEYLGLSTKIPSISTKIPTMSTKKPSMSTKNPTMSTKTPSSSTKNPTISTKSPFTSTKIPSRSTKYPTISTKYPSLPTKSTMIPSVRSKPASNDARALKQINKEKRTTVIRVRRRMLNGK